MAAIAAGVVVGLGRGVLPMVASAVAVFIVALWQLLAGDGWGALMSWGGWLAGWLVASALPRLLGRRP